jgi:hypothetical protein
MKRDMTDFMRLLNLRDRSFCEVRASVGFKQILNMAQPINDITTEKGQMHSI